MTDEPNGPDAADGPEGAPPTLADLLDDLADEFTDVQRRPEQTGVVYEVAGQAFARSNGATADFRLRPEIVAAAARTGDAAVSKMGLDWVSFTPRRLDQYALDRAQSWFELAHRLRSGTAGPRRH